MTISTMRDCLLRLGQAGLLLGMLAIVSGVCIASPAISGAGGVALATAAYVVIFAHVGSF